MQFYYMSKEELIDFALTMALPLSHSLMKEMEKDILVEEVIRLYRASGLKYEDYS